MSQATFSCAGCGRSFAWKEQLAGKRVKCKCGQAINVPATMPGGEADAEMDLSAMEEAAASAPAAAARVEGKAAAPRSGRVGSGPNVCHSCGSPLEPGAVLCVQCGYNWKTGQHMSAAAMGGGPTVATGARPSTAASGGGGAAPSLYPPGYRRRKPDNDEESGGMSKAYIAMGAVVLLLAIGVGGWAIYSGTGGAEKNVPRKGMDATVLEMIDREGQTEAKEWINKVQQRMLSGMTRSQALGLIDRLYGMGATRVFAFGGGIMCMSIGIELPDDPESRKMLFDWQAKWHEEMYVDVQTDQGQKYLLIRLRL